MPRGRPWKCPYCGSSSTTSKGKRVTKQMGIRRIRYCKDCTRKFTPKNQEPVEAEMTESAVPESPVL